MNIDCWLCSCVCLCVGKARCVHRASRDPGDTCIYKGESSSLLAAVHGVASIGCSLILSCIGKLSYSCCIQKCYELTLCAGCAGTLLFLTENLYDVISLIINWLTNVFQFINCQFVKMIWSLHTDTGWHNIQCSSNHCVFPGSWYDWHLRNFSTTRQLRSIARWVDKRSGGREVTFIELWWKFWHPRLVLMYSCANNATWLPTTATLIGALHHGCHLIHAVCSRVIWLQSGDIHSILVTSDIDQLARSQQFKIHAHELHVYPFLRLSKRYAIVNYIVFWWANME